jgi:hypothetical protein
MKKFLYKKTQSIFISMTVEEAKYYLNNRGLSSCSCGYGGVQQMIEVAILLRDGDKKTHL